MALAYLFEPTTQFQARTGANLTAGFLKVFYTQTDDAAPTYSDFAATPNEEEIVLDADGRAVVIVDDTKTYRLEVYNRNRGLLFTIDPITAMGGGGGGSMVYRVISTDGTVAVETTTSGGITYYDLSTAFTNEASKWGFRGAQIDSLDGSNDWQELPTVSTLGNVPYSFGWKATKDTAYDFAASVELPAGIAGAICGIDVRCDFQVDGVTVDTETGYIDPSRNVDRVSFEFKGQVDKDQTVDAKLYARCAEALTGILVGRVFYNEECDGIVGGGGGNYTAGDFVEITSAKVINVTGVQPLSGMSAYATQSAFDDCCSAMSGYVSSLSSQVSSISSTVSGLTGTYVEISSISGYSSIWNSASAVPGKLDESAFTAYTSTAQAFTGVTTDSTLTGNGMAGSALGVNKMELVFDETMNTSVSGDSAIVGVNKMELVFDETMSTSVSGGSAIVGVNSATMSGYALSADVSGTVDTVSSHSATWDSALSLPILIKTGSSAMASVTTGFQDNTSTRPTLFISSNPDQTAYPRLLLSENHSSTSQNKSAAFLSDAFELYTGTGTKVLRIDPYKIAGSLTGIYGSSFSAGKSGVSGSGWQYGTAEHDQLTGVYDTVSANSAAWAQDTVYSAGEYIDISGTTISVTGLQPVSGMSAYVEQSAFDDCCSAMSGYVSSLQNDVSSISSTVSGLTGTYVEISSISAQSSQWNEISSLSSYVEKSAISAQSSQWNEVSGLSGKLDSSASSNFYTTANESGFVSSAYVDSAVSGKQDILSAGDNISIVGNVISAANQKQSNWTESSNTSVQFIMNKPLTKELIAGANITMTEDLTSVTIAAAGGASYTAGNGISISSNTISIDTAVVATQGDLPVFGTITL